MLLLEELASLSKREQQGSDLEEVSSTPSMSYY